jgi:hypothetical protein
LRIGRFERLEPFDSGQGRLRAAVEPFDRLRADYNWWGKLGNTEEHYVKLLNRLAFLRKPARYGPRNRLNLKPDEPAEDSEENDETSFLTCYPAGKNCLDVAQPPHWLIGFPKSFSFRRFSVKRLKDFALRFAPSNGKHCKERLFLPVAVPVL